MKKLGSGVLAVAIVLLIVGCQSPTSTSQDPIIGTWNLQSMTMNGVTISVTPGSSALSAQYIFTSANTWTDTATTSGITASNAGTWSVSGGIYTITPAGGTAFTGSISSGLLTFTQSQNGVTASMTLGH
jgi:hypothetical protein